MVHATAPANVDAIMAEGLRPGDGRGLTGDLSWHAAFYGQGVVYLSRPDSDFLAAHSYLGFTLATVEVDVEGLPLVADLVSLVDARGRLVGDSIAWRRGTEPEALRPHLRAGRIRIRSLLDPASPACRAAIEATGTAAHLGPVPAARLSLPSPAPSP